MKDKDVLKKAIELYEKDESKDEIYEKQTLEEMNIPQKYYEQAKKELGKKHKLTRHLLLVAFFLVIIGLYYVGRNILSGTPQIVDFKSVFVSEQKKMSIHLKILNPSSEKFILKYKLIKPNHQIYDSKIKNLYIKKDSTKDIKLNTKFSSSPSGKWKIVISFQLTKGGIWEKGKVEKNIEF